MVSFASLVALQLALLAQVAWAQTAQIQSLDFSMEGSESVVRLQSNAPITVEKSELLDDQQIVLKVPNSVLDPTASTSVDTSSFDSPVSMVKAYPAGDQPDTTRIVVQLRANAQATVVQEGNGVALRIAKLSGPKKSKDNLTRFIENRPTKNFTGKQITIQVRDADVRDVLRLIGEASGFNIVLGPDVQGKLTLSLVDVPWDQALDVVLQSLGLGAERNQNILRVLTLASLTTSKQQELAAKNASEATAPRVTKIFPISYADIDSISKLMKTFGKNGPGESTATVETDRRTNSIVVQDIADNIDRMTKIIELLDTQTPQVLVEAKIVEATEGFSKNLGGNFGFGFSGFGYASMNGASFNPSTDLVTTAQPSSTGSGEVGMSLGVVPGSLRINAVLTMSESENSIKIVSSPKTVVLNKEQATILQSTPVVLSASVATQGAIGTQKTVLDANVSLRVTPTVTNDEGVLMAVDISRDIPQSAGGGDTAIAKRNMQTKVLVENGNTLVIGGIYTVDKTKTEDGFPFLRKIPIIGTLFGTTSDRVSRTELFIFLTPKILNTKKAGLT